MFPVAGSGRISGWPSSKRLAVLKPAPLRVSFIRAIVCNQTSGIQYQMKSMKIARPISSSCRGRCWLRTQVGALLETLIYRLLATKKQQEIKPLQAEPCRAKVLNIAEPSVAKVRKIAELVCVTRNVWPHSRRDVRSHISAGSGASIAGIWWNAVLAQSSRKTSSAWRIWKKDFGVIRPGLAHLSVHPCTAWPNEGKLCWQSRSCPSCGVINLGQGFRIQR